MTKYKTKKVTKLEKEALIIKSTDFLLKNNDSDEFDVISLFNRIHYKNQKLTFYFNKDFLKEHYLNLKGNFLNTYIPYIKALTKPRVSKYSLKLYEHLRSYIYINNKTNKYKNVLSKEVAFLYKDIAKLFYLDNENSIYFKKSVDFKKKILEPVKRDINNETDLILDYEFIKEIKNNSKAGRPKYIGVKFIFELKKENYGLQKQSIENNKQVRVNKIKQDKEKVKQFKNDVKAKQIDIENNEVDIKNDNFDATKDKNLDILFHN